MWKNDIYIIYYSAHGNGSIRFWRQNCLDSFHVHLGWLHTVAAALFFPPMKFKRRLQDSGNFNTCPLTGGSIIQFLVGGRGRTCPWEKQKKKKRKGRPSRPILTIFHGHADDDNDDDDGGLCKLSPLVHVPENKRPKKPLRPVFFPRDYPIPVGAGRKQGRKEGRKDERKAGRKRWNGHVKHGTTPGSPIPILRGHPGSIVLYRTLRHYCTRGGGEG